MGFEFKFTEIQEFMEKMGVPGRDAYDLPTSSKRFPDGAVYRNEISSIERPSTMRAMQEEARKLKVKVHRVIAATMGATLLTMDELRELARMAAGEGRSRCAARTAGYVGYRKDVIDTGRCVQRHSCPRLRLSLLHDWRPVPVPGGGPARIPGVG